MTEVLTVKDLVCYRGTGGEVLDSEVTSIQVWVPVLREYVDHPDGAEGSVDWSLLRDLDDGRAVTVCVQSTDDPQVKRWGYGNQISPPRS